MKELRTYIRPAVQVVPLATQHGILQTSGEPTTIPVNPDPEEEGNQEEADVKHHSTYGVHWDEVW